MDGFNFWWIIWAAFNVLMEVCVGVIMAITMSRKGRIALFMIPLVAWQILWASWESIRTSLILEWLNESNFSFEWYRGFALTQVLFLWICIFLALVPAIVKHKSTSTSDADKQRLYD